MHILVMKYFSLMIIMFTNLLISNMYFMLILNLLNISIFIMFYTYMMNMDFFYYMYTLTILSGVILSFFIIICLENLEMKYSINYKFYFLIIMMIYMCMEEKINLINIKEIEIKSLLIIMILLFILLFIILLKNKSLVKAMFLKT